MNISRKKTAIASILVTGMAGAVTLQAQQAPGTLHKGAGTEGSAAMPMDMQNMQNMQGMMMNMMGMHEQMGEMMAACTKMMEAHANDHHKPSGEDETKGN